MEYIDLYDEDGKVIATNFPRGNKIPEGAYLMAVGIWLMNAKGEILVTKRSPQKKFAPNLWENTGGHVMTGESCEAAIIRELREETGIAVTVQDMTFLGEAKASPYFGKNYGVHKDFDLSAVKLQEGETCDAKAVTLEEFEKMATERKLAPSVVAHLQGYKENFYKFIGKELMLKE